MRHTQGLSCPESRKRRPGKGRRSDDLRWPAVDQEPLYQRNDVQATVGPILRRHVAACELLAWEWAA